MPRSRRKEVNSLIILVARSLWLERNNRVFGIVATMPWAVSRKIRVEFDLWLMAKLYGVECEGDRPLPNLCLEIATSLS